MSDAHLPKKILLAHRALMLLAKGMSEREAVVRCLASDPGLSDVKSEGLALVLGIVREQFLLDRIVQSVLTNEQTGVYAQSIFRIVTYLARQAKTRDELKSLGRSFRAVVAPEHLPDVELLLGKRSASSNHKAFSSLRDSQRISLETRNPTWWVEYCIHTFGRGEAIDLLSANSRPRYVRTNPLKSQGRTSWPLKARTLSKGFIRVPEVPGVYRATGPLSDLSPFFAEGLFQVQDLASFLAIRAADPHPRESILDLCAAPGAKTAAAAQLMKNRGQIVSVDNSRARMQTWRREIRRLGVIIAQPLIGDATRLSVRGRFDLVVVDPPCTGTGVLDRNPSMKWRLSQRSLDRYVVLQDHILDSASSAVRDDGRILYCTCSVTLEENEQVVSRFLASHPEFETSPILRDVGSPGLMGMSDCRRFYPNRDRTAGYFIARLRRVN